MAATTSLITSLCTGPELALLAPAGDRGRYTDQEARMSEDKNAIRRLLEGAKREYEELGGWAAFKSGEWIGIARECDRSPGCARFRGRDRGGIPEIELDHSTSRDTRARRHRPSISCHCPGTAPRSFLSRPPARSSSNAIAAASSS